MPLEALPEAMRHLRNDPDIFVEPPKKVNAPNILSRDSVHADGADGEYDEAVHPLEEQMRIYYGPFWYAEQGSARLLRRQMSAPSCLPPTSQQQWDRVFDLLKQNRNMHLTEKQRAAVQMAYRQKVSILTGGPGTGKSTSIRALLLLLKKRKIDVALAAPTGRAAKRLSEAAGAQAKTLHRLLEYAPHENAFLRNEDNPLPQQFVIVDEFLDGRYPAIL